MKRQKVKKRPIFGGEFDVKTLLPEDLIGLKIQAIANDPKNRFFVDSSDIRKILQIKINEIDIQLVRDYFKIFDKEALLNEWLSEIEQ